ncbi:MAG: pyridoxine 5'-phosphate synthase [Desulfobulbaceae bacterium]|nr:pyridoxine 5'-phosphate synthase [Desulfobulbaceae bacterium]
MPISLINDHSAITPALAEALRCDGATLLHICRIGSGTVTVLLTGDKQVRELNQRFRHQNKPTNVLSFPFGDGADPAVQSLGLSELGDIVISVDRAAEEARTVDTTLYRRLHWLMVHGLLHLLGYDHERSPKEARLMESEEERIQQSLLQTRRFKMINLAINVDHVATIRQARGINEPDPVTAAAICELAGAGGIVVHLREDRRHIQDRDVRLLRETVKTKLNLEMGAAPEIIKIALEIVPDMVTLVPEKRKELTTEGGLNVVSQKKKLAKTIARMERAGIPVSLFIDPTADQVAAAAEVGATFVELHTGTYAEARQESQRQEELALLATVAEQADQLGLRVNAGHGLNYNNTAAVAGLDFIEELSIGHAIISRAVFTGLDEAVREMQAIIDGACW